MTPKAFQLWLNERGAGLQVDRLCGPATRAAIVKVFANRCAAAVTDAEIATIAARLGCTEKQVRTVARVESGGRAFDDDGRPKMLFERHLFYRATDGKHGMTSFSDPDSGGYDEDSWVKLAKAACLDPEAAFASASWGKFQVLGLHFASLGYDSPLALAYSTVTSEAAHYELLARFIERNGLKDEMQRLSTNPDDCRPFARAYNGPRYERYDYHTKLAAGMR